MNLAGVFMPFILVALSLSVSVGAELDRVTREIFAQNGVLCVEDKLSFRAQFAIHSAPLDRLFNRAREGTTSLTNEVRELLRGESLQLLDCEVKPRGDFVEVRALSKVTFHETERTATLHWVAALPVVLKFPGGQTGSTADILVFDNKGKAVLWFPNLGPADDLVSMLDEYKQLSDFANMFDDVEYRCRLKTEDRLETLFFWAPKSTPSGTVDSGAIQRMHKVHPMSDNDVHTLFTSMKLAKPGYYYIGQINTNAYTSEPVAGTDTREQSRFEAYNRVRAPKYKVDGSFKDWISPKMAWKETGGIGRGHTGEGIDVKELFYENDTNYVYIFFRCQPTIQERYSERQTGIPLVSLYINSGRQSGATVPDDLGNSVPGADIRITIGATVFVRSTASGKVEKGCAVEYSVSRWDARKETFATEASRNSNDEPRLIAYDEDGVEMAIPLLYLQMKKGDEVDLICVERANSSQEDHNKIRFKLN